MSVEAKRGFMWAAKESLGIMLGLYLEHHNPVTGSWVKSHGHASYRTTQREERDPLGAELPLSNPYPQQGYMANKWGELLFIEGSDPFDYSSGLTIDGMPVSQAEFNRRMENGSITLHKTGSNGNVYTAGTVRNFGTSVWIDN